MGRRPILQGENTMLNTIASPRTNRRSSPTLPPADLEAIKARQRATWAVRRLRDHRHHPADRRRVAVRGGGSPRGSKVLDVAAGNGNCSLAAARRWCDVTSTDYVPALLENGKRRAEADRLPITFQEADAEALPVRRRLVRRRAVVVRRDVRAEPRAGRQRARARLPAAGPDRPRQLDAARVHRPALRRRRPARAAARRAHVAGALGHARSTSARCSATVRRRSARPTATSRSATVRRRTGSTSSARGTARCTRRSRRCRPRAQQALERDLIALIDEFNVSGDATMVVPAEYAEVVIVKR